MKMTCFRLCLNICIFFVATNSELTWNMFLRKSLSLCHFKLDFSTHSHMYMSSLKFVPTCIQIAWRGCLIGTHRKSLTATQSQSTFKPCNQVTLAFSSNIEEEFRIETFVSFQINLTFFKFDLKRSVHGCSYNKVLVVFV